MYLINAKITAAFRFVCIVILDSDIFSSVRCHCITGHCYSSYSYSSAAAPPLGILPLVPCLSTPFSSVFCHPLWLWIINFLWLANIFNFIHHCRSDSKKDNKQTVNKEGKPSTDIYNNDKVTGYAYLQYKLSDKRYLTINFW